jgi:Zn-dependent protease
MAIITLWEIVQLLIMSVVVGYIFTGIFTYRPRTIYEMMGRGRRFHFKDFQFAVLISAPAIVLHELAHKFVAIGFGFDATFKMFPLGLVIGVVLKAINSPFILIAPGFVDIGTQAFSNATAYRLIAFAGPATNALLWLIATLILKMAHGLNRAQVAALKLTKIINLILFVFNMIPFGPLDGGKVLFGPPSLGGS